MVSSTESLLDQVSVDVCVCSVVSYCAWLGVALCEVVVADCGGLACCVSYYYAHEPDYGVV